MIKCMNIQIDAAHFILTTDLTGHPYRKKVLKIQKQKQGMDLKQHTDPCPYQV